MLNTKLYRKYGWYRWLFRDELHHRRLVRKRHRLAKKFIDLTIQEAKEAAKCDYLVILKSECDYVEHFYVRCEPAQVSEKIYRCLEKANSGAWLVNVVKL